MRYTEAAGGVAVKTVVYLDLLLLINFLIGYFLLRAAGFLAGSPPEYGRALLGAAAASVSSLVLLAPQLPWAVQLLYQALTALAVVRCAFPWQGWRSFMRRTVWYTLLNLLLAGAVGLAIFRWGFSGLHTNNLAVYLNVSPVLLTLCVVCVYLTVRLLGLLFGPPQPAGGWRLELELAGTALQLEALCDSGFFLRDPLSGTPVILLSYPALRGRLPPPLCGYLDDWFSGGQQLPAQPPPGLAARPVLCKTAAGEELLPGIGGVRLRLTRKGQTTESERVTAAFSRHSFEAGGAEALFGGELLASAV